MILIEVDFLFLMQPIQKISKTVISNIIMGNISFSVTKIAKRNAASI